MSNDKGQSKLNQQRFQGQEIRLILQRTASRRCQGQIYRCNKRLSAPVLNPAQLWRSLAQYSIIYIRSPAYDCEGKKQVERSSRFCLLPQNAVMLGGTGITAQRQVG